MAVFTMVSIAKKIMQFGISVFEDAQEITIRRSWQGSKCDGDVFTITFFVL